MDAEPLRHGPAIGLQARSVRARTGTTCRSRPIAHDVAQRCIRPIAGEQPLHREAAVPLAPSETDIDQSLLRGNLAEREYVFRHSHSVGSILAINY